MSKRPFKKIEKLFHKALALPVDQRPAFLNSACAGDKSLRQAVEALLKNAEEDKQTESILTSPVADAAARFRADAPTMLSMPSDMVFSVNPGPKAIPGFEILEELGRGGMGVVYKVRQLNLSRIVALKMLLPGELAAPEMLARFRTEVETLAKLRHPNIITIYDIGEYDHRPYFTMEYIDGPSLDRLLTGRPQDALASARLIETLARAMDAVHKQGIIHRDLKPANILLVSSEGLVVSSEGLGVSGEESLVRSQPSPLTNPPLTTYQPKITDFGLAKNQADPGKLTLSGVTMGTPSYMAPEQAHGVGIRVGPATDIYALGSILYEMLAGRPPFVGDSAADVITQVVNEEPLSPSRLRPSLPRDLVTICLKCLEKPPRRRYASALDLAEDLRRFQAGEPIHARPLNWLGRTWRWCRRRPLVAGLCLACALLVGTLVTTVLVYDSQLKAALAQAKINLENQRQQIVEFNINVGLVAAEEGDNIAALRNFVEALRLDEGFSSEGEWKHRTRIGTALRQNTPLIKNENGAKETVPAERIVQVEGIRSIKLANGLTVVVSHAANAANLNVLHLGEKIVTTAAFSPDGRSLVIREEDNSIRVWDSATGKALTPKLHGGKAVLFAVFSPDGRLLATTGADRVARVWDPRTGMALTPPMPHALVCRRAYFSSDGGKLIVVQDIDTMSIWDLTPDMRPVADLINVAQKLASSPIR